MLKIRNLLFVISFLIFTSFQLVQGEKIQKNEYERVAGGEDERQVGTTTYSPYTTSEPIKSASALSPGVPIGNTWYDYQHNGSMGRMIDWGPHSGGSGDAIVHFGWHRLPGAALAERHYAYNFYDATIATLGSQIALQPTDEYAGYVNLQSAANSTPVICGFNNQGAGNQAQVYWGCTGFCTWTDSRVPDSVAAYGETNHAVIWPKFAYQEGTDTVTHIIAQSSAMWGQAIYYFRKVGYLDNGVWDYPPFVIDTLYTLSHDIVASKTTDKVALVWNANLAYQPGTNDGTMNSSCDTCSDTSPFSVQWDNDIYYQTSDDQGQTWNPRVNVTKYQYGEAGFRSYTDLSTLIDSNDDLNIIWTAVPWAADIANTFLDSQCRLFHYSESNQIIRTVANAEWETSLPNGENTFECGPGAWNIFIAKMSLSECNGKLYALWTQFNDLPNGITDDCAARSGDEYSGSANGELFISVSADNGFLWDTPRNLTNSYTPNCDPTIGYDCESDMWASMTRIGRQNQAGEDWSSADVVDPSGSYGGDYFLDVQYVHDKDAGGIVQDEGTWQLSIINWFRLACVEPIYTPGPLTLSVTDIGLPIWTMPGVEIQEYLTIENHGNADVAYSIAVEEDNGTSGWLSVSGFTGTTLAGLNNTETGTIHLNSAGVQTTEEGLYGRIIFNSNSTTSPDTIPVYLAVVDNLEPLIFDTLSGYLNLIVANNGNYGNQGNNGAGGLNLDFTLTSEECDSTANIYLYDASPFIGKIDGADTIFYHSFRQSNWVSDNSFRPQGGEAKGSEATYNWYSTGVLTTPDSTIALEQTFYAPTTSNASFMIKKLKVWSHDGGSHSGLRIGDIVDWDIPSDSGAWNDTNFDPPRDLIYQIGAEYDQDDTLSNGAIDPQGDDCVDQDTRYGGIAFLNSELNDIDHMSFAYSMYTARNDTFVFPSGNLIAGELWTNMDSPGYTTIDATIEDRHTVMCYEPSTNLGATDTLVFWTVLATVYNGSANDIEYVTDSAEAFACTISGSYCNCCKGNRGNVDGGPDDGTFNGSIDISDLVYLVAYMFQGGPVPPCLEEADCNGDGQIDISDLVCMVSFMFQGGFSPVPCP